jgi:hypothetical protein
MPTNNFEIELKKFVEDKDYFFVSEENGKKITYIIYSPKLKSKVRRIFLPYGIEGSGNIQYRGKDREGNCIIYEQGDSIDLSDKLILISKEIQEQEIDEQGKIFAEFEKDLAELEQRKIEWDKENKEPLPSGSERHFFISKNNEGKIEFEGSLKEVQVKNNKEENKNKNLSFGNFYLNSIFLSLLGLGIMGIGFKFFR